MTRLGTFYESINFGKIKLTINPSFFSSFLNLALLNGNGLSPTIYRQTSIIFNSFCQEMVSCGSDQGRRVLEAAGVAALRRGFPKYENTELGSKMPFLGGN